MIISLDKDPQTNISMGSLLALYGTGEGNRSYLDMRRNRSCNLRREEDITTHENPTISRITFLGHADTHNEFSSFLNPNEFVEFLERIFRETPELLDNLEAIDLFGCQVGRYQGGISFASEVARILSEKGYLLEVRAFSHRIEATNDYGRTLLREEKGEWSYLGLNQAQTEQYTQFKKDEKDISKQINKLVSSKTQYNDIINDLDAEESTAVQALPQLAILDAQIEVLKIQRQLIGNQISELIAALDQIIAPTQTPRDTLDSLDFCCFPVRPLTLVAHTTAAISIEANDHSISSASSGSHPIVAAEAKSTDSHITQQEMKGTVAQLREEGKKIENTHSQEHEQHVSSIPGFSPGGDSEDK